MTTKTLISLAIRFVQFASSAVFLGLYGATLDTWWWPDDFIWPNKGYIFGFVASAISVVYSVCILVPQILRRMPGLLLLVGDLIMLAFWATILGMNALYWNNVNCGYFDWNGVSWCRMQRAALSFSVINITFFLISIGLHITCVAIPIARAYSVSGGNLAPGGLFIKSPSNEAKEVVDNTNTNEITSEARLSDMSSTGFVEQENTQDKSTST